MGQVHCRICEIGLLNFATKLQNSHATSFAGLLVNYVISNTIVLEIP